MQIITKGDVVMKTLTKEKIQVSKADKTEEMPKFQDEFQSYLTEQMVKTTFNGLEVSTFSWYKNVLGI